MSQDVQNQPAPEPEADAPELGAQQAESLIDFEQSHRRVGGAFNAWVGGFGPAGLHQLCLPSPRVASRYVFRDGRAEREVVASCLTTPRIALLRDRIVRSVTAVDGAAGVVSVDLKLLEYSAAVLGLNYHFSDEELTMLHASQKWIKPMIVHACGGEDYLQRFRQLQVERIVGAGVVAAPQQAPEPAPAPATTTRPTPWQRIVERLGLSGLR